MTALKKTFLPAVLFLAVFIFLIIIAGTPGSVCAEERQENSEQYQYEEDKSQDNYSTQNLWLNFVKLAIALPLVLILAFITSRFISGRYNASSSGGMINILTVKQITKGCYLVLVKVGDRIFFLGCTADNINSLCEFDQDDFDGELIKLSSSFQVKSFHEQLKNKIKSFKKNSGKASSHDE